MSKNGVPVCVYVSIFMEEVEKKKLNVNKFQFGWLDTNWDTIFGYVIWFQLIHVPFKISNQTGPTFSNLSI